VRGGSDAGTCHEALHECLAPPHPHGDCDGGMQGHHPPPGDPHGGPGDADGASPQPPPPDDLDGGGPPHGFGPHPPPWEDGGKTGGPHACFQSLDTCAAGSDPVSTCVDDAVACLAAYPPPPPRR
jgi:hypothetical protein